MDQTVEQNQNQQQNSNPVSQLLTEKCRPTKMSGIILTERVRKLVGDGDIKANYLFYSGPGTGKSSLTRLLSKDHDKIIINGSADNGIDVIRNQITDFCTSISLTGNTGVKVVVIEECDGLSLDAWKALRSVMEKYSSSVRFIFNCNYVDKIPEAILSRVVAINFNPISEEETNYLVTQYCERVKFLLTWLKIQYTDEMVYSFVQSFFPDLRSIISKIQTLADMGIIELKEDVIRSSFNYSDLYAIALSPDKFRDPVDNYTEIVAKYGTNPADAVIGFKNEFIDYIKSTNKNLEPFIPRFIIVLWEHQKSLQNAPDKLVVLLSLVYSIQEIVKTATRL